MKRIISFAAVFFICVSLFAVSAAADNRISTIDVDVKLNLDGSADITAVWSGEFDEGTECYFPFTLGDHLDIHDLTVTGPEGKYETLDEWDVDMSRSEKRGKCGLNETDDGYEVCWGIGDYGNNKYIVSYTVDGVVGSYNESDGFNFMFINRGMNTGPTDATVTITSAADTALSNDNTKCWAFGFIGKIKLEGDGKVVARTEEGIDEDGCIIIMLEFTKGVFQPAAVHDEDFRDVKEEAFKDSDYSSYYDDDGNFVEGVYGYEDSSDRLFNIFITVLFGISIAAAVSAIIVRAVIKARFKRFYNNVGYFRDTPCGGDLDLAYTVGKTFDMCREGSVIGARIMRMFDSGCISIVNEKTVGAFGREKNNESVRFNRLPEDPHDRSLYELMIRAAGADGVLAKNEMASYCSRFPQKFRNIITESEGRGRSQLDSSRTFKGYGSLNKMAEGDKQRLSELIGYKKYLLDFSLIAEREVIEVAVWKDMLIYATLLGIADKVAEQLTQLYPQYVPQIETVYYRSTFAYGYYSSMYNSLRTAEMKQQHERSIGSGGSSSFGGGGGFSGGGFGGGTR